LAAANNLGNFKSDIQCFLVRANAVALHSN